MTTNSKDDFEKVIQYHPFKEAEYVCNVFDSLKDCQTIKNGNFTMKLIKGKVKVY